MISMASWAILQAAAMMMSAMMRSNYGIQPEPVGEVDDETACDNAHRGQCIASGVKKGAADIEAVSCLATQPVDDH